MSARTSDATSAPKTRRGSAGSSVPVRTRAPASTAQRPGTPLVAAEEAAGIAALASGRRNAPASAFAAVGGPGVQAHDAVMQGVPGRALTRLWEDTKGRLPVEAVFRVIGVSPRTAHRIKAEPDKPLDARTTDGIYRLESVRALAEDVLGSSEAADEWLASEAIGLEFRRPIDLLSSSPGAEAVKTLLQRMKHGVYA